MSISNATTGKGAKFYIGNGKHGGSTAYAKVGDVVKIAAPALSRESHDATNLESEAGEFKPGLPKSEVATITFHYVASAADPVVAAFHAGEGDFRIEYPNGVEVDFSGFPTSWKGGDPEHALMQGELVIQPSGIPVFAAPV